MKRKHELLNYLIIKNNYRRYLEIGVANPVKNYDLISVPFKFAVDPKFIRFPIGQSFSGTSDKFFEWNDSKFDIIFIDGLHEADQVYRDIENSFDILLPGGTIVMHDCLPRNEAEQKVPQIQGTWTGDVWKAFVLFREKNPYIRMMVVNMDFGMGVLTRSSSPVNFKARKALTYSNFQKHYKEWLNLVSVEEFLNE